jgi:hypothetical protein
MEPSPASHRFQLLLVLLGELFLLGNIIILLVFIEGSVFALVNTFYFFNTVISALLLFLAATFGFLTNKKSPSKSIFRISVSALIIGGALLGFRIYASHIEPRMLFIRNVTIETPKLSRRVSILHISDIPAAFHRRPPAAGFPQHN